MRKPIFFALLLTAALIVACGDSSSVFSDRQPQTSGFDTATVRLRLTEAQNRLVGGEVDGIRLTGYGQPDSTIIFGPEARERAPELVFQIPISVSRLLVEFLVGEQVVGVYSLPVKLTAGQELVISDPDFLESAFPLSALKLSVDNTVYPLEHPFRLVATGTFTDGSSADLTPAVSFEVATSSQGEVQFEEGGWARGTRPGSVNVVGRLFEFSPELSLTITDASLASLEIEPVSAVLPAATNRQFALFALYNNGTRLPLEYRITWSSQPSAIATVSATGLVTAQMPGACTVKGEFRGKSAQARVTVTEAVLVRLEVLPDTVNLVQGQSSRFEARGLFTDGVQTPLTSIVSWGSSDPDVVQVDDTGFALSTGAGQALVLANDPESGKIASGVVNVTSDGAETPVATSLAFSQQPGSVAPSSLLNPVTVRVLDQYGHPISVSSLDVTLSLSAPPEPREPEPVPPDSGSASSEGSQSGSQPIGSSASEFSSAIGGSSTPAGSEFSSAIPGSSTSAGSESSSVILGSSTSTGSQSSSVVLGSSTSTGSQSSSVVLGSSTSTGSQSTSAIPGSSASTSAGSQSQSQSLSQSVAQLLFQSLTADLSGTLLGSTQNGTVTFSDLRVNQSGTYVLTATASGLKPGLSTVFEVAP